MFSGPALLVLNGIALMLRISGGSFPKPLSAEEEKHYLELFEKGDAEARNILIERNMRLVAHVIKKYYTQPSEQDDLISIGTIGLIKGISSFSTSKGVKLATYVSKCIENEILMHFRSQKKSMGEISLSDSIETDKNGNSLSLQDVIFIDDDMFENLSAKEMGVQLIKYAERCLTEREMQIISMRYGLKNGMPKTQREVAQVCGISRSYVSRIEKKAIEKLKNCFNESL